MIYVVLKGGFILAVPGGLYTRLEPNGALSILNSDRASVAIFGADEWRMTLDANTDIESVYDGFAPKKEVPGHA